MQFENRDGGTHTGNHVLALRVHQKFTVKLLGARRRIAGEADARAAGISQVAVYHGLHVHRGSKHVVNIVDPAIMLRPIVLPGAKHGVASHHQLLVRILRKVALGVLLHDFLIFRDHLLQSLGIEVGIELRLLLLLLSVEDFVKYRFLDVEHDVAEHLDQAPVGVRRESGIIAALG